MWIVLLGACGKGEDSTPTTPSPPTCEPDCASRECGDDGCGGTCGECNGQRECSRRGECVLPDEPDPTTPSTTTSTTPEPPRCGTMYQCEYEHHHYSDGSGYAYHYWAALDEGEARSAALDECMNKVINGSISDIAASQRCEFQGCTVWFDGARCGSVETFEVSYRHEHYADGSGIDFTDSIGDNLTEVDAQAWTDCVTLYVNGRPSELMPSEICQLELVDAW